MAKRIEVPLAAGKLVLDVAAEHWPLENLCTFAARDNPRRAFLVVSKILGRHIAVKPHIMRQSYRDLAARIPVDLPGPILVVGLAETAICLGQGVHEELRRQTGRDDLLYIHSTRQVLDAPVLCRFEEPHSHASSHIIYASPLLSAPEFFNPRSLVIVDDEISTGTTIRNLIQAITTELPGIENVVAATLADWSNGMAGNRDDDHPIYIASLLTGTLTFIAQSAVTTKAESPSFGQTSKALGEMTEHRNFGRLGRHDVVDDYDYLVDTLDLPPASCVRVIGTGEFGYPPFRIAEILEIRGHDVVVQSTTRSPIHLNEAIRHKLGFEDNYRSNIPNFLYNADIADGRINIICHETPVGSIDPALVQALDARLLHFGVTI